MVQNCIDPNNNLGIQRFSEHTHQIPELWVVLQSWYPWVGSFIPSLLLITETMHSPVYHTNTGVDLWKEEIFIDVPWIPMLSISGLMYRIRATQRWNNMPVATSESSLSLRPSPIECKEQEHRLLNSRKYINTFKSAPAQKTPWTALQTKRTRTESSNWRDSMLAWSLVSNSCPIAFFTWGLLRVNTATPVQVKKRKE